MRINEGKHLDRRRRQKLGFLRLVVLREAAGHRHAVGVSVKSSAQLVGSSAQDFRMVCNRVFVPWTTIDAHGFVIGIQDTPRKLSGGEVVNASAHRRGWLDAPVQSAIMR